MMRAKNHILRLFELAFYMKFSLYLAAALVLTLTGTSARPANNLARSLYVPITLANSKEEEKLKMCMKS